MVHRKPLGLGLDNNFLDDRHELSRLQTQGHQYCTETSIHGIKYIGERNRTPLERVLWIVLCLLSLILCGFLIQPIYNKWQNSPTITTVASTNYPVWNINFPAVTICSNNRIMKKKFEMLMRKEPWASLKNHSIFEDYYDHRESEDEMLGAMEETVKNVVFKFTDRSSEGFNFTDIDKYEQFIFDNYITHIPKLLRQGMHSCKLMIMYCIWQGEKKNCSDLFVLRRTDNGFCCSFNAVNMNEQFVDPDEFDSDDFTEDEIFNEDDEYDYYYYDDDFDYDNMGTDDEGDTTDEAFHRNTDQEMSTTHDPADLSEDAAELDITTDKPLNPDLDPNDAIESATPNQGPEDEVTLENNTLDSGGPIEASTDNPNVSTDASTEDPTENHFEDLNKDPTNDPTENPTENPAENPTENPSENPPENASENPSEDPNVSTEDLLDQEGTGEDGNQRRRRSPRVRKRRSAETGSTTPQPQSKAPTKRPMKAVKIRKSNSASTLMGLSVVLHPQEDSYFLSSANFIGHRLLVHSPYDFAEVSGKGFAIGQRQEVFIGVGAQLTESTPAVRSMSIQKRQCIQFDENLDGTGIKMETFTNYSRPSCILECRAKLIFAKCNCLPYYFPDFSKPWKKRTTCSFQGLQCIANNTDTLNALSMGENDPNQGEEMLGGADCHCPSDCTETVYSQEMSQAPLDVNSDILTKQDGVKFGNGEGATLVHVYFKELGIVKFSRDVLYSLMDVIAAFGGIVGLCMGFSLLSGAELIYFFTLRMFIDVRKERKEMDQESRRAKH